MTTTRQERRAKLKAEMASVEKRGVDATAEAESWWWPVAAEARHLIDILRGTDAMRAGAAAQHAHDFYENSVKNNTPDGPVECAKGCSLCCSLYVSATAPEVFCVANYLRREHAARVPEIREKVRNADRDTRYMERNQRLSLRLPCPMLNAEGACSVYTARPSACRSLVSSSLRACERGFAGEGIPIPRPKMWWKLRGAHVFAQEAALVASGLTSHHYSFNHALRIALENLDAEQRWLDGEDVFANVEYDSHGEKTQVLEDREQRLKMLIAGALAQELPEG
jgi:hypothetical protein